MNHYQQLIRAIDDLILDKAQQTQEGGYSLSVYDCDEDELGQLAHLFLEQDDRDTSDCFHQGDQFAIDDHITCALIKMLTQNNADSRDAFAQLVRQNTIKKYRDQMQALIDIRCSEIASELMAEHGLYSYQNRQTGEYGWRKIG